MILLGVDTSGKHGSIALARVPDDANSGSAGSVEMLEVVPLAGGTFSAQLVPQISGLLSKHGLGRHEIGGFAVASGPGSFTGLRVGLAAIKALAEVLEKPIAAVSLLEVVARSAKTEGNMVSVLDAGRGEVYAGEYGAGERTRLRSERLLPLDQFLGEARGCVVVTPDPALADAARSSGLKVEEVPEPGSDAIVRLGWEKIQSSETVAAEDLEANYIRRSGAEIFAKTRS